MSPYILLLLALALFVRAVVLWRAEARRAVRFRRLYLRELETTANLARGAVGLLDQLRGKGDAQRTALAVLEQERVALRKDVKELQSRVDRHEQARARGTRPGRAGAREGAEEGGSVPPSRTGDASASVPIGQPPQEDWGTRKGKRE